jgi:excisionase family DNA binding protein
MNSGKFLTSKQAAEKLGFAPGYIRRMCVDGTINAEKLGKTWIINVTELKKIKRQRHPKETDKDAAGSNK